MSSVEGKRDIALNIVASTSGISSLESLQGKPIEECERVIATPEFLYAKAKRMGLIQSDGYDFSIIVNVFAIAYEKTYLAMFERLSVVAHDIVYKQDLIKLKAQLNEEAYQEYEMEQALNGKRYRRFLRTLAEDEQKGNEGNRSVISDELLSKYVMYYIHLAGLQHVAQNSGYASIEEMHTALLKNSGNIIMLIVLDAYLKREHKQPLDAILIKQ